MHPGNFKRQTNNKSNDSPRITAGKHKTREMAHARPIWVPNPKVPKNIDAFRQQVNQTLSPSQTQLQNYRDVHAWSIDPKTAPDFWRQLFLFENLKAGVVPERIMQYKV